MTKVRGKDEKFWEKIKKWDVIDLMETWMEKEKWERWRGKVPGVRVDDTKSK